MLDAGSCKVNGDVSALGNVLDVRRPIDEAHDLRMAGSERVCESTIHAPARTLAIERSQLSCGLSSINGIGTCQFSTLVGLARVGQTASGCPDEDEDGSPDPLWQVWKQLNLN